MNEIVKVGSNNIPVIEWKGQRVITTAQLASIYETDTDNIKKNFQHNKEHFKEREHYFYLTGDELREFKDLVTDFPLVQKNAPKLYLWTRKGASRHCKMLGTDKAWEQFDELEENYYNPQRQLSGERLISLALIEAYKVLEEKDNKIKTLETDNQRMKPKEEFFDAVTDSKDAIEIGKVAKVLNYPGVGRNKLFEILRDKGVLMRNNIPYQKYIDNGCFRTVEQKYSIPTGETRISIKTLVYQKGVDYIRKVLDTE